MVCFSINGDFCLLIVESVFVDVEFETAESVDKLSLSNKTVIVGLILKSLITTSHDMNDTI